MITICQHCNTEFSGIDDSKNGRMIKCECCGKYFRVMPKKETAAVSPDGSVEAPDLPPSPRTKLQIKDIHNSAGLHVVSPAAMAAVAQRPAVAAPVAAPVAAAPVAAAPVAAAPVAAAPMAAAPVAAAPIAAAPVAVAPVAVAPVAAAPMAVGNFGRSPVKKSKKGLKVFITLLILAILLGGICTGGYFLHQKLSSAAALRKLPVTLEDNGKILTGVKDKNVTAIEIPSSVTKIAAGAFKDCAKLKKITIPDSVEVIEKEAFANCSALKSVSLSSNVKEIGEKAFYHCGALEEIALPKGTTKIGRGAFAGVKKVSAKGNQKFFNGKNGELIQRDGGVLIFVPTAVSGRYITPPEVRVIGSYAFDGCSKITGLAVLYGVSDINENACKNLKLQGKLVLPSTVKNIKAGAFNKTKLSLVYIQTNAVCGKNAFSDSCQITRVDYPENENAYDYDLRSKLLFRKAELGEEGALHDLGVKYYYGDSNMGINIDYKKSFEYFDKAAAKGNISAMNYLGLHYRDGDGVTKNISSAVDYFTRAGERGEMYAMYNLGFMYLLNSYGIQDKYKGFQWMLKSAEKGHASAQNVVGECYQDGTGTVKDIYKAVIWFKRASAKGDLWAKYHLGCCYLEGEGVQENEYTAFRYFSDAAGEGHVRSMCLLGGCYENGWGTYKNIYKAVEWYKKAAAKGDEPAKKRLRELGYSY